MAINEERQHTSKKGEFWMLEEAYLYEKQSIRDVLSDEEYGCIDLQSLKYLQNRKPFRERFRSSLCNGGPFIGFGNRLLIGGPHSSKREKAMKVIHLDINDGKDFILNLCPEEEENLRTAKKTKGLEEADRLFDAIPGKVHYSRTLSKIRDRFTNVGSTITIDDLGREEIELALDLYPSLANFTAHLPLMDGWMNYSICPLEMMFSQLTLGFNAAEGVSASFNRHGLDCAYGCLIKKSFQNKYLSYLQEQENLNRKLQESKMKFKEYINLCEVKK